jgi:hypothetical protein
MAPAVGAGIKKGQGAKTYETHHCSECNKPPSNQCFKKLHVAYCEQCDYKFNVISPTGCANHKFADGFNRGVQNERRGLDRDHKTPWEIAQEAKAEAAREEAARVAAEVEAARLAAPQYKEKRPPPQKKNERHCKKQPKAQDLKGLIAAEEKAKKREIAVN